MSGAGAWTVIEAATRGLPVRHVARAGRGAPLLLVHGVGPGTTGLANFAPLIEALPGDAPLHMIDLAGFGGSARKPVQPGFDIDHWLAQIDDALERIGAPAVLVGNSVGGALALKAASRRSGVLAVLARAALPRAIGRRPQAHDRAGGRAVARGGGRALATVRGRGPCRLVRRHAGAPRRLPGLGRGHARGGPRHQDPRTAAAWPPG